MAKHKPSREVHYGHDYYNNVHSVDKCALCRAMIAEANKVAAEGVDNGT